MMRSRGRRPYTQKDDDYLAQYIAKYNPDPEGRTGNSLYQRLVENEEGKWPWSTRHSWQSWRTHYRDNQDYFNRLINKHLRMAKARATPDNGNQAAAKPPPSAPAPALAPVPVPAPAPAPAPAPPRSRTRGERVEFTREDDDRLASYLAAHTRSEYGRQSKKLYEELEQEDWAAPHTSQSWRERYRNNMVYFDRRAARIQCGKDDEKDEELEALRPRTVESRRAKSVSSQTRQRERERSPSVPSPPRIQKEKEKRKRVSEEREEEASPRKRQRRPENEEVQAEPVPGPSRQKTPQKAENAGVPDGSEDEQGAEGGNEEEGVAVEAQPEEEKDELEGDDDGGGGDRREEEEEEEEEEEDQGPIGSDDYRGDIFEEADEEGSGEEDDELDGHEQEEAQQLLTDDPHVNAQDEDTDVNMADEDVVTKMAEDAPLQHEDDNPFVVENNAKPSHDVAHDFDIPVADFDDTREPILSTTPPSGASPPPRPHIDRIERSLSLRPDTPELSPAEQANARHHLQHAHSPAPPKKHAPRLLRKRPGNTDEDFFGTPQTDSASLPTSALPTAQNSPTAHHLAHVREHAHDAQVKREDVKDRDDAESPRKREPPRLDEGAWNTAFSDARGRPRVSPKGPRRSGVGLDDDDDGDEEAMDVTPLQWPPARGKAKGKERERELAPNTPARSAHETGRGKARESAPGSERLVTTERIVSVKTVRTVERRSTTGRPPPTRRAVAEVANDSEHEPSSPRTLVPDDAEDENIANHEKVGPSQHHPFSQPTLAPKLAESTSGSSMASSVFPSVRGRSDRKADIARLQRMLAAPRATEAQPERSNVSLPVNERASEQTRTAPQSSAAGEPAKQATNDRLRRARARTSQDASRKNRVSPPVRTSLDGGRLFEAFEEREQSLPAPAVPVAQSSPLARHSSKHTLDEIVPHASSSRVPARQFQYADKGKARAGSSSVARTRGHARRYTLAGPPIPEELPSVPQPIAGGPFRHSLPVLPSFSIGDDSHEYHTALSLLFNPPPSGAGLSRLYTLPPSARPLPPAETRFGDATLADTLPARELEKIKALGMQVALACMARNHGFGEETVRGVFAETRSLELADRVLREMREGANERANRTLESLYGEDEEGGEDEDMDEEVEGVEEDHEESEDDAIEEDREEAGEEEDSLEHPAGGDADAEEGSSLEVESVLGQETNSWMDDDMPQAESSHIRGGAYGHDESGTLNVSRSKRKAFRIKLLPKEPEEGVAYSPPKKTRASRAIKQQARSPQRTQDAMDVDGETPIKNDSLAKIPPNIADVGIGQLAKYDADDWRAMERKYGPGAARKATQFALAKLLRKA